MKKLLSLILCGTMVLSLASCSSSKPEETVKNVEYLGIGPVTFVQHSGVLIVDLPDRRETTMPGVLKISF